MRGAIGDKNVTFKSGSTFYNDEALRDNVSIDDVGARFDDLRYFKNLRQLCNFEDFAEIRVQIG